MTDPLTPERLAELRHAVTVETWRFRTREDGAALIGEIDRLTARHRLERERAETLEAENAKLAVERDRLLRALEAVSWRFIAAAQLPYQFENLAVASAHPQAAAAFRAVANLIRATIHPEDADPEPQRAAEPSAAASAQSEPPEAEREPQRPAEDFGPPRCPEPNPLFLGEACVRVVGHSGDHRDGRGGGWPNRGIAPKNERAESVDLSGELDDFGPEQIAELKRISGLSAPTDGRLYADGPPCRHDATWLIATDTGPECMVCGPPAQDTPIAPEDEGVSSADVTAQQAADQRAYCPDCGHPETNCACG